jgi:hypothetical protein
MKSPDEQIFLRFLIFWEERSKIKTIVVGIAIYLCGKDLFFDDEGKNILHY